MSLSGVPDDLLAIMQCPVCGGPVADVAAPPSLVCERCGRRYPVADGIPDMVVDEAASGGDAP